MKILFLSRGYPPQKVGGGGGIATYTGCMAPLLAARGHEVHVISCMPNQERADYSDRGVHVHRRGVSFRGPWWVRRMLRLIGGSKTRERILQGLSTFLQYRRLGIDFDVIEYPDWFAEGWVFALLRPRPLIATLHGSFMNLRRFAEVPDSGDTVAASHLEHFAVRRVHGITAPSSLVFRTIQEAGWLPSCSVKVLPFPLDWSTWRNTDGIEKTPPVVLFIGRIYWVKAPELLVKAMSLVRKEVPEAKALFLGNRDAEREGLPYVEWIKQSVGTIEGCEFVGFIPRNELATVFAKSRVLAMPSLYDTYPLSVLEAMACGRPVVVSSMVGTSELVKQAGGGVIVPAGDAKALAAALLPYLRDAAYAAREGEKARAAAQELLDPDRIAAQREAVYQEAIDRFHQGRAAASRHPIRSPLEDKKEPEHG